jgi:hypothetical protein
MRYIEGQSIQRPINKTINIRKVLDEEVLDSFKDIL